VEEDNTSKIPRNNYQDTLKKKTPEMLGFYELYFLCQAVISVGEHLLSTLI
jgi:hypothetical protein